LAAGSAHAFNQVYERDIDALMHRTARRPLATAQVTPRAALVFGTVLLVLALTIMLVWVNPLAAALTLVANLFYIVVYTMLLKRRTSQNIVWGGAAGCMPTLIGWAAVTGTLAWTPVLLFLVVFFWTPAHYWPLAIRFREDYARAGVPMLPVVVDAPAVGARVTAYAAATVATSLVLWPVAELGWIYGVVAVLAGGWFLLESARLWQRAVGGGADGELSPMRVFHGSITYLTLVFAALALDVLILT
jgi:protoheme IX farnesyltransferase